MTNTDTTPRSLRRIAAGAVAALALGAGLLAPSANAATPTTVTIEAQVGGFFGYVQSADDNCEANRTVTLHKVKKSGKIGKAIGSDLAQPNGPDSMYSIASSKPGKFVAKVAATPMCSAAQSTVAYAQV